MSTKRRAGAPRLIEWTGERCVPWAPDVQVIYEHYHRYLWAAELVRGRRVLDLGSGEGFGSAIIAGTAEHVLGIDVDQRTVDHSQLNYAAPNLEFRVGSALELDALEPASFGAVVAFEIIEHVADQERVLSGIERVLAEDGVVVLSTPDRRMYSDAYGQTNPFHAHELSEAELREMLGGRFAHVGLWGQRTVAGSRIAALDDPPHGAPLGVAVERAGDDWREAADPAPVYLVAVASRMPFDPPPGESMLSDAGLEIVRAHERLADAARGEAERAGDERDAAQAREAYAADVVHDLERDLEAVRETRRQDIERLEHALIVAHQRLPQPEVVDVAAELAELRRIRQSVTWRYFQRARGRLYTALGGRGSLRGRALQWSLRRLGGLSGRRQPAPAPPPPIMFAPFEDPVASIVIPVYDRADLTEACLKSISRHTDGPSYEVILVDDRADEATQHLWERVDGARILRNEQNIGYLRSVNRGAAAARGRHLVLLNNDTEVRPGWLEALVDRAESATDIGAVSPKLLYPDGRLQEAGGIIFQDGSGWNYGRDQDPAAPEYNWVREVDYGSAACLLVRTDVFRAVGGYDERFMPMYYEDADLCFAVREQGCRVLYEPRAEVVHLEGGAAGTDLTSGGKRHQELNRPKFAAKWSAQLAAGQLRASPSNVRRASFRNRGAHVLVIDHRLPMPDRDAGSVRMETLLRSLVDIGHRVTFLPDNFAPLEPYLSNLQGMGVEVLYGALDLAQEIASIGAHLRMAIVSRPYVAARYLHLLREHAPGATVAYDTVDLHFVREQRRAELAGDTESAKAATMRELELGLVRASDVTFVVSDDEREQILAEVPDAQVVVMPVVNRIADRVAPPDGRSGVLFVGGFEHRPNIDAVQQLVRAVMPQVWQQLGEVPVTVVGADPPPEVLALSSPSVDIAGWVEDLQPLLDGARVMVAPLRFGAGMKGKVTQSLATGLPVVTTTIGAEGLHAADGREMLIADDPAGMAERIVRVYGDDELWRHLSAEGRHVVERTCSPAVMLERLRSVLNGA